MIFSKKKIVPVIVAVLLALSVMVSAASAAGEHIGNDKINAQPGGTPQTLNAPNPTHTGNNNQNSGNAPGWKPPQITEKHEKIGKALFVDARLVKQNIQPQTNGRHQQLYTKKQVPTVHFTAVNLLSGRLQSKVTNTITVFDARGKVIVKAKTFPNSVSGDQKLKTGEFIKIEAKNKKGVILEGSVKIYVVESKGRYVVKMQPIDKKQIDGSQNWVIL